MDSRISIRPRMDIFRPSATMIIVAKTIKPRPPTWIRTSRTICPKTEKVVPVSTATRPVTQTADVAVNRLSNRPMPFPLREAAGNASKTVPSRITARKPRARMLSAC